MFIASIVGLAVLAVAGVVALNAAHIPGLRELVGAAPLQADDTAVERPDNWAARLEAADKAKETRP